MPTDADRQMQKAGEGASDERRERPRVTLSGIVNAIITTDDKGGVIFPNPAARSSTGWTGEGAGVEPRSAVSTIVGEETWRKVEPPAAGASRGAGRRAGEPHDGGREGQGPAEVQPYRAPFLLLLAGGGPLAPVAPSTIPMAG